MKKTFITHLFFFLIGKPMVTPEKYKFRLFIFAFCCLLTTNVQAQFLGGFFSQQSDKEKLMAEQVVGIQTYFGAVKVGYSIMESGLNTAHELKGGTFNLHTAYFNSLGQVNPIIQNNPKGKVIADLRQQLVNQFDQEVSWQIQQKLFNAAELSYLEKVSDNLQKLSAGDMAELHDLLTTGKLQLTDQQRLDRLDKLYTAMKDKATFAASFTTKCRQLALTRQRSKAEKQQLKQLYGIQ